MIGVTADSKRISFIMAGGTNGQAGGAVGQEQINTDIVTLTRFLTEEQTKHKEATGDFTYDTPLPRRFGTRGPDADP